MSNWEENLDSYQQGDESDSICFDLNNSGLEEENGTFKADKDFSDGMRMLEDVSFTPKKNASQNLPETKLKLSEKAKTNNAVCYDQSEQTEEKRKGACVKLLEAEEEFYKTVLRPLVGLFQLPLQSAEKHIEMQPMEANWKKKMKKSKVGFFKVKTKQAFAPQKDEADFLAFSANAVIDVHRKDDSGIWTGKQGKQIGHFYANMCVNEDGSKIKIKEFKILTENNSAILFSCLNVLCSSTAQIQSEIKAVIRTWKEDSIFTPLVVTHLVTLLDQYAIYGKNLPKAMALLKKLTTEGEDAEGVCDIIKDSEAMPIMKQRTFATLLAQPNSHPLEIMNLLSDILKSTNHSLPGYDSLNVEMEKYFTHDVTNSM